MIWSRFVYGLSTTDRIVTFQPSIKLSTNEERTTRVYLLQSVHFRLSFVISYKYNCSARISDELLSGCLSRKKLPIRNKRRRVIKNSDDFAASPDTPVTYIFNFRTFSHGSFCRLRLSDSLIASFIEMSIHEIINEEI